MIINKIYNESSKKLSELDQGDLFEYNGLLCIKTDNQQNEDEELIYDICVVLATGRIERILNCTHVNEVKLLGVSDDGILSYTTKN